MAEISYFPNMRKKRLLRTIKLFSACMVVYGGGLFFVYWIQQRPINKAVSLEDAEAIAQLKEIPNISGYVRKATIAPKYLKRGDFELAIFGAVEECQRIKKLKEISAGAYDSESYRIACSKALALEERIMKEYAAEKSLEK